VAPAARSATGLDSTGPMSAVVVSAMKRVSMDAARAIEHAVGDANDGRTSRNKVRHLTGLDRGHRNVCPTTEGFGAALRESRRLRHRRRRNKNRDADKDGASRSWIHTCSITRRINYLYYKQMKSWTTKTESWFAVTRVSLRLRDGRRREAPGRRAAQCARAEFVGAVSRNRECLPAFARSEAHGPEGSARSEHLRILVSCPWGGVGRGLATRVRRSGGEPTILPGTSASHRGQGG
jgi:hypothetical protein